MQGKEECGIPLVHGVVWIYLFEYFVLADRTGRSRVDTSVVGASRESAGR